MSLRIVTDGVKGGLGLIKYERCSSGDMDKIYEAFKVGFSDYVIKLEMPKEVFVDRFFGPEGNQLENSFVALDGDRPIGLLLGGVKRYEGVRTLRCGALCLHPDYRGKGISRKLFALHKENSRENNCKQMFLEVIVGNDRAINFYRGFGYEKVYDIGYYSYSGDDKPSIELAEELEVKTVDFDAIRSLAGKVREVHINWQNDFDYMEKLTELVHYGVYQDTNLIGGLSLGKSGKAYFLWVNPAFRHQGIASFLVRKGFKELNLTKLMISFPNNASLEGFVRTNGFKKEPITQYEMYLWSSDDVV